MREDGGSSRCDSGEWPQKSKPRGQHGPIPRFWTPTKDRSRWSLATGSFCFKSIYFKTSSLSHELSLSFISFAVGRNNIISEYPRTDFFLLLSPENEDMNSIKNSVKWLSFIFSLTFHLQVAPSGSLYFNKIFGWLAICFIIEGYKMTASLNIAMHPEYIKSLI